mmetsp:Transcript_22306/g.32477  ORF Transcript_22306/g.32477 Transcript_22306/m.32477 type:complete len:137 (+) Transcript_22306:818-1228(+)
MTAEYEGGISSSVDATQQSHGGVALKAQNEYQAFPAAADVNQSPVHQNLLTPCTEQRSYIHSHEDLGRVTERLLEVASVGLTHNAGEEAGMEAQLKQQTAGVQGQCEGPKGLVGQDTGSDYPHGRIHGHTHYSGSA